MSAGVLAVDSFASRGHARWMTVAGANPREKGIHDAAFGHYGVTVAKVSFEHEYSHDQAYGAKMATDYAERIVACADAMKGIDDPRAFVATVTELIEADQEYDAANTAYSKATTGKPRNDAWDRVLVARKRRQDALAKAVQP